MAIPIIDFGISDIVEVVDINTEARQKFGARDALNLGRLFHVLGHDSEHETCRLGEGCLWAISLITMRTWTVLTFKWP